VLGGRKVCSNAAIMGAKRGTEKEEGKKIGKTNRNTEVVSHPIPIKNGGGNLYQGL